MVCTPKGNELKMTRYLYLYNFMHLLSTSNSCNDMFSQSVNTPGHMSPEPLVTIPDGWSAAMVQGSLCFFGGGCMKITEIPE